MIIDKVLFHDTSGKPSVTMTAFVWGCLIVNAKLLASGVKFGEYTMSAFGGGDYATALGALGAVYVLRRHPALNGKSDDGKQS